MDTSESAANRVKKIIEKASYSPKDTKGKLHAYKQQKPIFVSSGFENISVRGSPPSKRPLGKAKVIPQKPPKSALEQMHCTPNQNYPLFFIEKAEALLSRKIESIKLKEQFIATRNLKNLSHQMQQWIYAQLHQEIKVLKKERIELYDLLERREERHFRLDRIIKYLSD